MFEFEHVLRQSHHLLAAAIHVGTFSVSWFLLLTVFDAAWCLGRAMTYHVLLREGHDAAQLAGISPNVCTTDFKHALRSNLVLVVVGWIILYYYQRQSTVLHDALWLGALFLITMPVVYLRTLGRFYKNQLD